MEGGIDFGTIARATSGASGAELANIINEAALRAVRMGHNRVKQEDLMESVEVILAGYQRKGAVISPKKRKSLHTTRSDTHWLRQSRKIPLPCRRLRLFPEPAVRWAIPCR